MFKNYIKIAYRSIVKDKYYSIISFLGLTIGLAFFGLMLLVLNHEFNYDSMYADADRIYRLTMTNEEDPDDEAEGQLPMPLADVIRENIASAEIVSHAFGAPQQIIETTERTGRLDGIVISDGDFFEIFDLEFNSGDARTALDNQMSIVLTKDVARQYFGSTNVIGKTMNIEAYGLFTVTGVLEEIPRNSSFQFTAIMNANIDRYLESITARSWFVDYYTGWNGHVAHTYVKLAAQAQVGEFVGQIDAVKGNYFGENADSRKFDLQPIKNIHFGSAHINSNLSELTGKPGNVTYIYVFAGIAVLILVIACINYMNLSSARSIRRTSEVGVRSVFGAGKMQIVIQFLLQSILMALISVIPAMGLLQFMVPYFEIMTGIEIALGYNDIITVLSYSIPSVIIIGIISGLYPSFMLVRFTLAETVKKRGSISVQSSTFRKGLVVGQFALAYAIIVLTLITSNQIEYIFDKELGFDSEQVIVMEINDGRLRNFIPDLKQEVVKHNNVLGIAGFSRMISGYREPAAIELNKTDNPGIEFNANFYAFDEDAIEVMELEVVQGRNFLGEGALTLDSNSILINETAAQQLFPNESAIGKELSITQPDVHTATIVGIIKDFHYRSLHVPIEPLVVGYISNPIESIDDFAIRIAGNNIPESIAHIEAVVGQFIQLDEYTGLEYEFLDSMIQDYYAIDQTYKKLFLIGAWITILLSTVGLVGLTSFYSEMRTKEFGIRKVLGATIKDLISLQSTFFLKLILIAISVGIPLSFFASTEWLKNFNYQVEMIPGPFILALATTLIIALLPISLIAYKNSYKNPIDSLKSE